MSSKIINFRKNDDTDDMSIAEIKAKLDEFTSIIHNDKANNLSLREAFYEMRPETKLDSGTFRVIRAALIPLCGTQVFCAKDTDGYYKMACRDVAGSGDNMIGFEALIDIIDYPGQTIRLALCVPPIIPEDSEVPRVKEVYVSIPDHPERMRIVQPLTDNVIKGYKWHEAEDVIQHTREEYIMPICSYVSVFVARSLEVNTHNLDALSEKYDSIDADPKITKKNKPKMKAMLDEAMRTIRSDIEAHQRLSEIITRVSGLDVSQMGSVYDNMEDEDS